MFLTKCDYVPHAIHLFTCCPCDVNMAVSTAAPCRLCSLVALGGTPTLPLTGCVTWDKYCIVALPLCVSVSHLCNG